MACIGFDSDASLFLWKNCKKMLTKYRNGAILLHRKAMTKKAEL